MCKRVKLLALLFCLFIFQSIDAQSDYCFQLGTSVNLSALDFSDCNGALTYDISEAGADDCTGCDNIQNFTIPGNIIVTAYEGGEECDEIIVTLVNGPDINLNVVAAADCNEITFDGNFPETVTDWSWDFNDDDDEDANSESGIYVYTENGSIEVELTVTYSQGCLATSTQNIDVNGPIADLLIQGNPEGDVEFESIFTTTFAGNSCTIPFCVDDIENTHSIILDDNTANFSSTNQSFTITLEGVGVLYTNSVGLPPSAINYDFPAGASGFYELTYEVVDQDGCSHIKTYQVYISEFSSPDTDLVNITAQQDAYCVGENLQFELTADSQNPEDVTYYFAIGCNTPVFNPAGYVFLQEYNLAPDEAVLIDWPADVSSCQCPNDRFTVYTYVDNPCQTEPLEGATQPIEVALDTSPDFDAPDILCVGDNMDFLWEGAENLGNSYCGPDLQWNITAPDLTIIDGGDDEDINFTFDQVGTYTVCLEIEGCGGAEADILCETICVQELLTTSSPGLVATFPTASVYCINEIFEPTITLPPLFCEPPTVTWSVTLSGGGSANGDYSIDDNNSLTPTITFTGKGDYVVRAQVFSECGNPSFTSTVVSVGGPPTVHADAGVLTSCPDEVLCFDESFCVDDCNANFTTATVTVYEGTIANCSAPIANTIAWQSGGNPLVSFPADMQGAGCLGSNNSCNFSWLVPAIPLTDYTVVVEVINACGTDVACMPINVIVPGSLTIPVPAQVCAGYTIDPQTTALSNCNWLINGSTVWSPGNTNLVTINAAATVTVNCTLGACPQSVSKDVTVFPAINPDVTGGTVICQSGSVNLSASSDTGTSFQWFEGTCAQWQSGLATEIMGETGGILEVTSSGTYAVQITDSNGCEACAQHSVTEESAPTESCADVSFCETETSNLVGLSCATVPVGGTIIWTITDESNGTVSTNIPNTYSVGDLLADYGALTANHTFTASYELTSANGCEYSGDYTITINQLGLSTVIIEESCFGSAFPLVGGVDANWNSGDLPAGTFSISGGNLNINGALTNGTYTGITYNDGCAQQPYQIVIFENPTVALLGDTFICNSAGSTQDISADAIGTGTISYQWNNGPCNAASAIPTETAIDYTVTTAGGYSVSVTDDNGCEACAEVTILLDEMPTESCADLSFCETETAEEIGLDCLTVPAGGTLTWDLTDSGNSNVSTGMAATFTIGDVLTDFGSLTANETFTAAYTFVSANSCSYEGSYQVTIQNLGIGAIIDVDTCFLTDFNLAGGAGGTWTTGDLPAGTFSTPGGNLAINNLLTAGNYNGIGYDSGCSQQPYSITITDLPTVTITGEDYLCDLDNATQTITAVAGGEAPFSYQWAENTCLLASPIAAETSAAFTLNSEGTYSVLLTDNNGCEACGDINVLLDASPTSSCTDEIFCENLGSELVDLSCVSIPAGSNSPTWTISHETNSDFPYLITAGSFSVDDLLTVFDPLEIAVQSNEVFNFYHQWISDDGCVYLDSVQVTILDESVELEQLDFCSGDELNLTQPNNGDWIWTAIPVTSADVIGEDDFIWNTTLGDAGSMYEMRYTSEAGCGAVDYEIQVNATPVLSISTPEVNMCILTSQDITIDSGIATDITIDYEFNTDTLSINTTDLLLDPTALAITDTDPGQLHFQGSLDYVTLLGGILTCSSEAFQAIDIIDTLSSLAVPSFICQGEEFDIDLCGDGIVDEFTFTLGGTSYTSADCPFEIPTLFGTQAYDLEATYGGVFALQCQVQDAGEITIQQQLVYDYEVISDPCAGGQEVQFTITSGNTTSITLLPGEVLSSDILEAGDVFTEVLTFTPADEGTDEQFDYAIEITDGVCTTEIVSDIAQFIAVPDLGISIDELISDFDGCGNDFLTMQISVPNTNFIDGTIWTIESDYFAFEELVNGAGLLLPDVIELGAPPLESSIVIIAAEVFNLCGSDADTVFHIMNPADIQLQVADLEPQVCPGETIQVNTTVNLDFYDLDVVITPAADIDWNPLTETLVVGAGVPSGDYSVEFTATGECGVDVATANFSVFEFFSAEFDITGFNCAEESIYFSPLNAPELSGFEWDFGDMTTANNQFPVHIYDDPGIYEVTLSAFHSGANCQVTFTDEVEIGGEQVTITPGNIGYCGASEAAYSVDFINPQEVVWSITNPYTSEVLEYFTESTPILYFDFDEDSDEVVEYLIGVYALDEFGCPSSQSVSAEVFPAPKAEIAYSVVSATSDVASNYSPGYLQVFLGIPCSDVQIDFFNNEAVNNCFWTNDLGEMCGESFDNCSTLSFCTDEEISGQLTIQVDNEYQCTATDVLDVEFICADEVTLYVPNSFTPNYDGINDVFEYTFRGVVEDFELLIFNRWGEVIFESNELYDYWDGSDERGDYFVADGVYNWKIIINSERTGAIVKKGHVSILR